MKNQPKVSLIIPVYNGENYLKEAIDSALAQTYENVEIIVVDDGSTDNTEEIALSYGEKIRYLKKANGGVSTALNLAIKEMKGEYFSWLSHDDKYYPEKISTQIDYLKNNNLFDSNVILYSNYDLMDTDSKIYATAIKNHQELIEKPEYGLLRGAINGLSLLIPKKAFDECGVFDETLRCTQDYELWERMMQKYKFIHQEEVLVTTRIHASQTGQTSPRVISEGNQLWINMIENTPKERKKQLEGSEYNFYCAMKDFIKDTPYKDTGDFIDKKIKEIKHQTTKDIKNIKVSVIIPFYNREKELERAVKSVLNQTHKNIELILIDDGSSCEISFIKKLMEKNKNIKYIKSNKNYGPAYSRNKGIEAATGEYIAFLDSDDEFTKTKIEKQLLEMHLCNYIFSHTSYIRRNSDNEEQLIQSGLLTGSAIPRIISNCIIATPTIMVKTSYLKQNNFQYDTNLQIGEDVCFYLETLKNIELLGINEPLTIVNVNNNSSINNLEKQTLGLKNILKTVLNDSDLFNCDTEISYLIKNYYDFIESTKPANPNTINYTGPTKPTKHSIIEKIKYPFLLYKNDRPKLKQLVFNKLENHPRLLKVLRVFVRFIKKILGKNK